MRIYEFSKQIDIPVKTVMQILADNGLTYKSHMALLTDEARLIVERKIGQKKADTHDEVKKTAEQKKPSALQQTESPVQSPQQSVPKGTSRIKELGTKQEHSAAIAQTPVSAKMPHVKVDEVTVQVEPAEHVLYLEQQALSDFSVAIGKPINDIIVTMLRWGLVSSKNQLLSQELVARLAKHYDIPAVVRPQSAKRGNEIIEKNITVGVDLQPRLPVVVVIGHVDHGKTSLLDFIRRTRVAAKEKGGITQHLGAYQVHTKLGDLVFLDTPGHEAFSKMRQRGVRIADIAILVIAADDGVMPQTIEAIKHARQMNVPIVVAANKIDKVGNERLDVIKRQLAQHEVLVEDWGGSVVLVPISAKTGLGIDTLLDMLILQTQLMDLRADRSGAARGFVLESHVERGLGPVATLLVQQGTLDIGDYFSSGQATGKVTSITSSAGQKISKVLPFIPVQVAGFSQLPNAGDQFQVVDKEEYKKLVSKEDRRGTSGVKLLQAGAVNLLIKTDTNSSKEALLGSLETISKRATKPFSIVYAAAGDISESDVELAYATSSDIIGLHVKAEVKSLQLAQQRAVNIELYDIIYRAIEALERKVQPAESIALVKTKIGEARVLKVFDIKNLGVIAGCIVTEGRIARDAVCIVWRGTQKIGEGKITSLQREKKSVKEAHTGFECGFIIDGITDWKPDDKVECYLNLPAAKK
jgi:translation initiation factor IF-2